MAAPVWNTSDWPRVGLLGVVPAPPGAVPSTVTLALATARPAPQVFAALGFAARHSLAVRRPDSDQLSGGGSVTVTVRRVDLSMPSAGHAAQDVCRNLIDHTCSRSSPVTALIPGCARGERQPEEAVAAVKAPK